MEKHSYNKRQVGTEKETLAAEYLEKKGYFIIEKNYRVRQGEIDLIARDGVCIVFVEVKYREDTADLEDGTFLFESEENKH